MPISCVFFGQTTGCRCEDIVVHKVDKVVNVGWHMNKRMYRIGTTVVVVVVVGFPHIFGQPDRRQHIYYGLYRSLKWQRG